jgi:hypothetical protein
VRTLSSNALGALANDYTDEVFVILLKLEHDDLAEPIRVANNNENVVRTETTSVTYVGVPFEIELPPEDAEEPGAATISIPNVDRTVTTAVRAISTPVTATIMVVLASSPNTVEVQYTGLTLREVMYDAEAITGILRFETLVIEPITFTITPARFPGLF